ncbi:hypothetical protein ABH940_003247 [Streptacidiphilus sp. BW17]|uniref:hypothetical protein n=1 Tax=unclassified Streptacidiphilus TaxID=2643834 RepID=UPI0035145F97
MVKDESGLSRRPGGLPLPIAAALVVICLGGVLAVGALQIALAGSASLGERLAVFAVSGAFLVLMALVALCGVWLTVRQPRRHAPPQRSR